MYKFSLNVENICAALGLLALPFGSVFSEIPIQFPSFFLQWAPSFKSAIKAGVLSASQVGLFEIYFVIYSIFTASSFYIFRSQIRKNIYIRREQQTGIPLPVTEQRKTLFRYSAIAIFLIPFFIASLLVTINPASTYSPKEIYLYKFFTATGVCVGIYSAAGLIVLIP